MITTASQLYPQIEALPALDKFMLVEWILNSLDKPDPDFDNLWLQEAENRLNAYEQGQLETIDLNKVLQKYGNKDHQIIRITYVGTRENAPY